MDRPIDPVPDQVSGPVAVVLPCVDEAARLAGVLAAGREMPAVPT